MHIRNKEPSVSFAEYIAKVNYVKALILTFSINIYLLSLILYYLFARDLTVTRNIIYFISYCLLFGIFTITVIVFINLRNFTPRNIKLFNTWLNALCGFTIYWALAYSIIDLYYDYPLPVLSFLTATMVFLGGLTLSPLYVSIIFTSAWVVFNLAGSMILYDSVISLHLLLTSIIYIGIGLIVMYTNYRIRRRDWEQTHILKKLNTELEVAVRADFLTGLGNRLAFDETFAYISKECLNENMGLGLLFIDIDNFKTVNDKFGHQKGDEILKYTTSILKNIHPNAFRFGGEEFILLLKANSVDELIDFSNNLCQIVEKSLASIAEGLNITASIGVHFETPPIRSNAYEFINYADVALYQAKKEGKNRVYIK